jgi:putative peptidoglycan lipid II flippase
VSLYRIGAFKTSDVPAVAGALRWWAAGLIFYSMSIFFLKAFYSLKDTRTPMLVNLALTVFVHIALYWVLSTGIGPWPGLGVNGIPISDGVFYFSLSVALGLFLRHRIGGFDARGIASMFARMTLASVVGAACAWGISYALAPLVPGLSGAILQVTLGGVVGLAIAMGAGHLLGVTEVSLATATISRTFTRRRSS